jgi:hypothetical protein
MNSYVKSICEEFCEGVSVIDDETIEVAVAGQYFTELYARLMVHGFCCKSILSNADDDTHIAVFTLAENMSDFGTMFDDFMEDNFEDDSSDWWKNQE